MKIQRISIIVIFIALFFSSSYAQNSKSIKHNERLTMYLGEVKVLPIAGIDRVAVGNPKVMSNSILSQGQLVVLANAVGTTTMYIWLENGNERQIDVMVQEKKELDNYAEIKALIKTINGVRVKKVGNMTVVEGFVSSADKPIFDTIISRYKDALNLVRPADSYNEITKLLAGINNIKISKLGNDTVISGEVAKENAKLIKLVDDRYPNLINMTKKEDIVAEKMVYMQVKIMEVSKSLSEDIGIDWNTSKISGTSMAFGIEGSRNGASILNSGGIPDTFSKISSPNLTSGTGYFGIATGMTSTIKLAENSGDAVTLAQPRLSARSGGKAEFLAGGEYPMPTTSIQGQTTIEFKKYGIILKIEPVVDDNNNIIAHVETEVSEIDKSVGVGDIAGLKTRSTQTDISMLENQTLVIAGLLNEEGSSTNKDVAWLRDLPVLGPLFRSNSFRNNKSELVIFITPTIHDVNSPANKAAMARAAHIRQEFLHIVDGNEILD